MLQKNQNPWTKIDRFHPGFFQNMSGDPPQWPIKLWKAPVVSPYYHHAHLLIASDCSAFFCKSLHSHYIKGKVPLICCMETDFDVMTKLSKIFANNDIESVTVLKLDKECCKPLASAVMQAVKSSHLPVPLHLSTIFAEAEDVD